MDIITYNNCCPPLIPNPKIVTDYYLRQKRSLRKHFKIMSSKLESFSKPELFRLVSDPKQGINISVLAKIYMSITHLPFPELFIYYLTSYIDPNSLQLHFSLSYNFNLTINPNQKPLFLVTNNPYMIFYYLAHKLNTSLTLCDVTITSYKQEFSSSTITITSQADHLASPSVLPIVIISEVDDSINN